MSGIVSLYKRLKAEISNAYMFFKPDVFLKFI